MKRLNLTLALAAAGLMTGASVLAASTTHDLAVSAAVIGNCKFNAASGTTLTIANSGASIDPSVATDASGTADITYRCTKNTVASVGANDGLHSTGPAARRVRLGVTTNYMPYSLAAGANCAGTGLGHASDLTCTVTGGIVVADFVAAPAGTYTDTVVLTISP